MSATRPRNVIDFRLRPPARGFLAMHLYTNHARSLEVSRGLGLEPSPAVIERSFDLMLTEMASAGVVKAVLTGRHAPPPWAGVSNDDVAALVREHPDRFVGFGSVDLTEPAQARAEIDRAREELGLRGLALDPTNARTPMLPDDDRLAPVYERCLEAGWPMMITASHQVGPDVSYGHPLHVDRAAAKWPELPIVVAHACWPYVREMLAVAHRRPNVYLLPDIYLPHMPGNEDYVRAANLYLADRMLFGTAYPLGPHEPMVAACAALPFTAESREQFFYTNAARLLGLPVPAPP